MPLHHIVNSSLGYEKILKGKELIVPMIGTCLASISLNLPFLVSTPKLRASMTLKGIIFFEALESIIQFFKVLPFMTRLMKKGSMPYKYATYELYRYIWAIWDMTPLSSFYFVTTRSSCVIFGSCVAAL